MQGCGERAGVRHCLGGPENLAQGARHWGSRRTWCALPGPPVGVVAPWCSPSMMIFGLMLSLSEPVACGALRVWCLIVPADAITCFQALCPALSPTPALQAGGFPACCQQRVRVFLQARCRQRGTDCGCFPFAFPQWALRGWASRVVHWQRQVSLGTSEVPDSPSSHAVCCRVL